MNQQFAIEAHDQTAKQVTITGPVRITIDYADNDPEAVDILGKMIVEYLNSLPDEVE